MWSWCALALPALLGAQTAGTIVKVSGTAAVVQPPSKAGQNQTQAVAKVGDKFHWRDALQTAAGGRLRVQLLDGSILSIGQRTKLVVNKHDERTQQSSFELIQGKLRANVVHLTRTDSSFEIRTSPCVMGVLGGGDILVDADNPTNTVVWASSGKVVMNCWNWEPARRLEVPGGYCALSSEGILHPLTADMLDQMDKFSLLNKLSDTIAVLKSKFSNMGLSGQPRHPLTALAVPITRGRYVT
jgi:hypothetical protein